MPLLRPERPLLADSGRSAGTAGGPAANVRFRLKADIPRGAAPAPGNTFDASPLPYDPAITGGKHMFRALSVAAIALLAPAAAIAAVPLESVPDSEICIAYYMARESGQDTYYGSRLRMEGEMLRRSIDCMPADGYVAKASERLANLRGFAQKQAEVEASNGAWRVANMEHEIAREQAERDARRERNARALQDLGDSLRESARQMEQRRPKTVTCNALGNTVTCREY